MKRVEELFEGFLWNARLIMIVPVLASLLAAIGILVLSAVNTILLLQRMAGYLLLSAEQQLEQQAIILSDVVGVVDQYLIVAILVIFADGMYELFVGNISAAEKSSIGPRVLVIRNLDDLKDKLVSVVLVILVVKFFQQALKMHYETPTDLLLLAAGIAAVGAALFLTKKTKPVKHEVKEHPPAE
ncbi:MAG: YqhA family protein [Anaerolineae bacterium]|nr:YqhA family protein [Anaerolineae bacterium]